MSRSPANFFVSLFPCWDTIDCLNASILTTAVFELLQEFYHAIENHCHCCTIADIKPLRFQNKVLHDWKQREKNFPKNIHKQTEGDFHCLEVQIKIMTIKKGPRHSLSQPNKSHLPFFPK